MYDVYNIHIYVYEMYNIFIYVYIYVCIYACIMYTRSCCRAVQSDLAGFVNCFATCASLFALLSLRFTSLLTSPRLPNPNGSSLEAHTPTGPRIQ